MSSQLLREAVQLAQAGQKDQARPMLRQVVQSEPDNETAWLWLASVASDRNEYQQALQQVLRINPDNLQARERLAQVQAQYGAPAPPVYPQAPQPGMPGMAPRPRVSAGGGLMQQPVVLIGIAVVAVIVIIVLIVALMGGDDGDGGGSGPSKTIAFDLQGYDVDDPDYAEMSEYFDSEDDAEDVETDKLVTYAISVSVPESWYLADENDPAWREKRAELEKELPVVQDDENNDVDSWDEMGVDLTEQYIMGTEILIVETDVKTIKSGGMPSAFGLEEVRIRTEGEPDVDILFGIGGGDPASYRCSDVRDFVDSSKQAFEEQKKEYEDMAKENAAASGMSEKEALEAIDAMFGNVSFNAVETRDGLCAMRVDMVVDVKGIAAFDDDEQEDEGLQYFENVDPPEKMRMIQIAIPLDEDTVGVWMGLVPEHQYGKYKGAIAEMIETATITKK